MQVMAKHITNSPSPPEVPPTSPKERSAMGLRISDVRLQRALSVQHSALKHLRERDGKDFTAENSESAGGAEENLEIKLGVFPGREPSPLYPSIRSGHTEISSFSLLPLRSPRPPR